MDIIFGDINPLHSISSQEGNVYIDFGSYCWQTLTNPAWKYLKLDARTKFLILVLMK